MVSPYLDEKEILKMLEERVPMVLVGYRAEDPRLDFVDSDNVNAAILAVDHLVKLGHKKIACITGEVKMSHNAADRLAGFLQAMKNHGLPVPTPYIVEGNFRKESGSAAMKNLLALPNRPTAVFVCNDTMAFSAIEAMEKAGLKAGKDIAIVGFDDVAEASLPLYSLTTLHQDFVGMGMEATRLLMEKIKRPQNWKPRQLLVPAQLVIRQSCGAKN
jgi:DNA-binding LacI/PurR family transcriptional regulator